MTATETATETTTEMKMQVTANRPPRPTAAASRNCVRRVVRKTLSYRNPRPSGAEKRVSRQLHFGRLCEVPCVTVLYLGREGPLEGGVGATKGGTSSSW